MADVSDEFRQELKTRLLQTGIVDRVEDFKNDLVFEIGTESRKVKVFALIISGAVVFHAEIGVDAKPDNVELLKFLNTANRQIPFGNFFVSLSNDVAFKFSLLNSSVENDRDISFSVFWIFDMFATFKIPIEIAASKMDNASEMAERLLTELRNSPDEDSEEPSRK